LVRLGSEATPLLVLELDPGSGASEALQGRSKQVALVLSELSTSNVTVDLLKLLHGGTLLGQQNALSVLAHSDDPNRVGPVLRARFAEVDGEMRARMIAAIATLGGEDNFNFIGDVLGNKDPAIVKSALLALTEQHCVDAAPKIGDLVRATLAAAEHIPEIVDFYRACPEVVDEDHCKDLVKLAQAVKRNPRMAELVLFLLSEHEDEWDSKIKKELKLLAEAGSNRISEAAMICLARSGDHRMEKKLLAPFNASIEKNDGLASSWQKRAEVKMRIGKYKNAISDFLEARRLTEGYQRSEPDIYIGIARCYARLGKEKDAYKWLNQGSLNISQLHLLSRDSDFAKLLEDDDLRKVFRLDVD
jgi:hypothetical protein